VATQRLAVLRQSDKKKFTVLVTMKRIEVRTMEGQTSIPGPASASLLETGEILNLVDTDTFEGVLSHEIFNRC